MGLTEPLERKNDTVKFVKDVTKAKTAPAKMPGRIRGNVMCQNVCRPVYPRCGDCVIAADCRRIGVDGRGR